MRSKVWFPGINKKVEEMIKMCNERQCNRTKQNFEPLRPSSLPQEPWQELSADFYGPMSDDNKYWLVLIDDYSRFPIVETISSTAADEVIPALEEIMSVFGTPEMLKTDNGPPFNSIKFKDFSVRLNFVHKKITPYWPRANGEAEKFMINLSKVRKNAQVNGNKKNQELMLFLRAYRATPHCVTKVSPSILLMGFNKTSGLPSMFIKPASEKDVFARENDKKAKEAMKIAYDRRKHVS